MKKKLINLKAKIDNHFMVGGNKSDCEKKKFKNIKILQKKTKKNHKEIIKLAIINATPIIKMRQIKIKKRKNIKEFPYVLKKYNRISLSIKSIINQSNKMVNTEIYQEIIQLAKLEAVILKTKETNQLSALSKKKYSFFRWFY